MKAFDTFEGITVPFDRANIDTDVIIPKQFLKSIQRTGFGPNLFDEWRYLDHVEHNACTQEIHISVNECVRVIPENRVQPLVNADIFRYIKRITNRN